MNWKEFEPKTIALRQGLLDILAAIRQEGAKSNLPEINSSVVLSHDLLAKPSYDVVICGEVKKGKSTFINALIGKNLLPTGVKETTSQVFRISNSEEESYALVFTDATRVPISASELTRYGSQVDADLMGEPVFKDRRLDYIHITLPLEFLPKGVSIVDTPGLGALYQSHELITHRYIQNAAAVVFILDPGQPLVQQEKAFLQKVFAVTPYVMFVMTKIDCYDETQWVNQIRRSETLLKEAFEETCYTLPKIFPVASTTLYDASQEQDAEMKEELVEFSYFPNAQAELLRLMYLTVGLSRTRFAFDQAVQQKSKALAALDEQLKMIVASTKEEQDRIKNEKIQRKSIFEQTWGPVSLKRKEVTQQVQMIVNGVQNRASQITATSGSLYRKNYQKIEDLKTLEQVDELAATMVNGMLSEASDEWQGIALAAQREVMEVLNLLKIQMDEVAHPESFASGAVVANQELSTAEKFQSFKAKYFDASITTGIGGGILGLVGISLSPVVPLLIVGTILWGWWKGKDDAEVKQIEKNKAHLKSKLSELMGDINAQLFHVPLSGSHLSTVQQFVIEMTSAVEKAMLTMYEKEKTRYEKELQHLEEQAKLDADQKQQTLVRLNEQRRQWLNIATNLDKVGMLLTQVRSELQQ